MTKDEAEALKLQAEADKLAAEAEMFRAQSKAALAEANKDAAEAAQFQAETRQWLLDVAKTEIDLAREQHKRGKELADEYHHVHRFTSSVGGTSVGACMTQLATWHRLEPGCPIEIVFTSPGGEIISGMALFDYIVSLREDGHQVTTKTIGYAASMAGILLQAGDHRVMSPESWLLIHQASFGAVGDFGKVEDMVKWVDRIQERILDIFAERTKTSGAQSPMSRAQIKRRWHRKDWWLSSDEALKWGFVDEVAP